MNIIFAINNWYITLDSEEALKVPIIGEKGKRFKSSTAPATVSKNEILKTYSKLEKRRVYDCESGDLRLILKDQLRWEACD